MRHVRMLGFCLVAALALAAYAVSSASAANPEWGRCEAKAGGKYEDSNCTVKAKGKTGKHEYEWKKGSELPNIPFTSENKEAGRGGVLTGLYRYCANPETGVSEGRITRAACAAKGDEESHNNLPSVECERETATGEESGKDKVVNVHVTFTGCGAINKALPCKSEGAASGEIKTTELQGKLGWISKSSNEVGVMLEPAKKHGLFAAFTCVVIGVEVGVGNKKEGAEYTTSGCSGICPGTTPAEEKDGGYDEIISPITPVNQMSSSFEQVYTVNPTTYKNEPAEFEGKHISLLEDSASAPTEPGDPHDQWSEAGEEITNVNTPTKAGEIKA